MAATILEREPGEGPEGGKSRPDPGDRRLPAVEAFMIKPARKTVITGIGCVSGAGATLPDNMDSLFNGVRNLGPPERFTTDHVNKYPVFEVPGEMEDPAWEAGPGLTRTTRLALGAARQAVAQSGLCPTDFSGTRTGVCLGTSTGSSLNSIQFYDEFRSRRSPNLLPVRRYLNSNPAACLSRQYRLNGPVQTVVNACSSGTDALGIASTWIEQGVCDIVIAGGADELTRVTYNGFISLMITDHEPSRPFDGTRNGLNLGEGAGIMVLESEQHALANGRIPLGSILGYGMACDAHHLVAPHPAGLGLRKALDHALTFSRVPREEIAFVNAHGTGTRDNDRVESRVLADLLPGVPFGSTKGCTGHTLAAAGALEAAFSVACLNEQRMPPSTGFKESSEEMASSPVSKAMDLKGNVAVSQSLAFGGNNSVLVLEGKGE